MPYLISGGLFGLGLVFVGGLVYFASWLAKSAMQQQRQSEEVADLLREIRDGMQGSAAPTQRTARSRNGASGFVATAKGGMLHRPDCSVVAGRDDVHAVSASGDGLSPCTLCNPFDADVLTH